MARTKVISAKEAAALIKDGDTVLVGGFMTNGTAKSIVNEVTAKNLTVVCNEQVSRMKEQVVYFTTV